MSPLPQLSFTSMAQLAERHVEIPSITATVPCCGSALLLYRYRLDFDAIDLHLQGLAQLCPACLTLYYSQQQMRAKRTAG